MEWTVRQVHREDPDDSGWRLQALLQNRSSRPLKSVESEVRYFDSAGRFIGVDEGFSMSDELEGKEDKTVSIALCVPAGTSKAVFSVKGKRAYWAEKHSFLLFGAALLISALLFTFAGFFKK